MYVCLFVKYYMIMIMKNHDRVYDSLYMKIMNILRRKKKVLPVAIVANSFAAPN